jgi:Protein of unknown function (DUF4043)
MAEVVLASASEKQVWTKNFLLEYVRESSLMPYMGKGETSIFRFITELKEQNGIAINVPLITRLKGRGVRGAEVLKGNEDDLGNFNDQVRIDWLRNAVKVPKSTSYRTEIDLLDAAKSQLRTWDAEALRDDIIDALGSFIIPGISDANGIASTDSAISYALATAAQRNTHLVNNADRTLFGASRANAVSNVWATSAATVNNVAGQGRLSAATISLAKRLAKVTGLTNGARIRPYKSDMTAGREWYVLFANSFAFRDISQDATIIAENVNSRPREGDGVERNPLFQDGDLMYQGVIIREMPELPVVTGAGAGGIDIGLNFLCGQSAVAIAYGQDPILRIDDREDYAFRPGIAIEELRGQKKVSYSGSQYGVVTLVNAAVADA